MLTKFKKVFLLVMFAAFTLVLAGCGDSGKIKSALKGFNIEPEITEDFTLPTADASVEGSVTVWTSDNEAIKIDGTYAEVKRSSADVTVVLTATVELGETTGSREFTVTVKKLEAPTSLTIEPEIKGGKFVKNDAEENQYLLVKGFEGQLNVVVPEDGMSNEVQWVVGNKKVLSVDENGKVTGLTYGTSTVTAMSTTGQTASGQAITHKIEIKVVEDLNPRKVLLNNKKAIQDLMPRFVFEDTVFPKAPNKYVDVYYATMDGEEIYDGEYTYVEGLDRIETIFVKVSYEGEEEQFEVNISVVKDPENNEFLALDYAEEQLNNIFGKYSGKGKENIKGNIEVPTEFLAEAAKFDVAVSYEQETDYQPKPIKFDTVGEAGAEKMNLIYSKPNDNADVRIIVYIRTTNVDRVIKYNVTAQGYTQEEIVKYITEGTLPKPGEDGKYTVAGKHLSLPEVDATDKFNRLTITWKSSDEKVLTNNGKFANPELDADTKATLTATLTYGDVDHPEWTQEVAFEYIVKPATDDAQKVSLQLSTLFEKPEFMDKIKHFPFGDLTRNEDKTKVNIMPLPNKVSEVSTEHLKDYQDLPIVWGSSEEGLIDANHKLLKQYLRYHEVALTYTVTVGEATATNQVIVNVGVAEQKNTFYVGGNFTNYQMDKGANAGDVLSMLSKFDASVGNCKQSGKTWGFGGSFHGSFGGYTYYIDGVDEETGRPVRYQFYTTLDTIMYLEEDFAVDTASKKAVIGQHGITDPKEYVHNYATNWGLFFVNNTGKEVKIPLSPLSGQGFLGAQGDDAVKWGANPYDFGRDFAFSFDGWRNAFVMDETGKVVLGSGEGHLQDKYDADGDGKLTEADYWVSIPAGGYGMAYKTQSNDPRCTKMFCVKDAQLTVKFFEPFYMSEDGNKDGYGELIH